MNPRGVRSVLVVLLVIVIGNLSFNIKPVTDVITSIYQPNSELPILGNTVQLLNENEAAKMQVTSGENVVESAVTGTTGTRSSQPEQEVGLRSSTETIREDKGDSDAATAATFLNEETITAANTEADGQQGQRGDENKPSPNTPLSVTIGNYTVPDHLKINTHLPPCSLLIFNRPDWHYEVMESAAIRFPIPWHKYNCSTARPIHTDFWVSDTVHKMGFDKGNDKVEHDDYVRYFNQSLAGTLRRRADGLIIKFGVAVPISNSLKKDTDYTVKVQVSTCRYMERENHFCIGHVACENLPVCKDHPEWRHRICWLNSMNPSCNFVPRDLPQFPPMQLKASDPLVGCIGGTWKDIDSLGIALQKLKPTDVEIRHLNRFFEMPSTVVKTNKQYDPYNISHMVKFIAELDFVKFQKLFSECDFLLPLLSPTGNAEGYFPHSSRKQSGSISQAIAYQMPTILHTDLYHVFSSDLHPASTHYTNTTEFTYALQSVLEYLRNKRSELPA